MLHDLNLMPLTDKAVKAVEKLLLAVFGWLAGKVVDFVGGAETYRLVAVRKDPLLMVVDRLGYFEAGAFDDEGFAFDRCERQPIEPGVVAQIGAFAENHMLGCDGSVVITGLALLEVGVVETGIVEPVLLGEMAPECFE